MTRFRARSSVIYSSIVMGLCAVFALVVLIASGWTEARPAFGILGVLAALAYTAYFRPSVDVYADRAELVNVLSTATVPFSRLTSIGTRWSLELVADDSSKATAFAAPAPSAMKARGVAAKQEHLDPEADTLIHSGGPSTSSATASGAAAHMIDDAYQAWKVSHESERETTAMAADASAAQDERVAVESATAGERLAAASAALEPTEVTAPQKATASGKAIERRPNWLSITVIAAAATLMVLSL